MATSKSNSEKYTIYVIGVLLILTFFQTCGTKGKIKDLKTQVKELSVKQLKSSQYVKKLPTAKDIKIEGLKVEKRMIQATNRKMLDVERQNQIEKEISELEKK